MDPETCLARIETLVKTFEGTVVGTKPNDNPRLADVADDENWQEAREEALEAIGDYRTWRRRGGFEPLHGDAKVAAFRARIQNAKPVMK